MASKKKGTQDRPVMDMGGTVPEPLSKATQLEVKSAGFLGEKAEEDREDARTQHANKGLRNAKDTLATMTKAVAHGLSSDSEATKHHVLAEVADLGNAVRDGCRSALRSSKGEKRNVQS